MKTQDGEADGVLYQARQKIYPREISGRFQRLRTIAAWVLLGIYYVLPWIRWEGRQAVLFDLPARKFYVFGLTLWPQDFFFLTWLLVIAALSLFFFTALAGRVFCGYACPQTVWTEAFLGLERMVEGSRSQQIKLSKAPWCASTYSMIPSPVMKRLSRQGSMKSLPSSLTTGVSGTHQGPLPRKSSIYLTWGCRVTIPA